jgi:formate hydrogenlyase subunit 3/multisubunit Na+/H+ antiporter MnhD subunit
MPIAAGPVALQLTAFLLGMSVVAALVPRSRLNPRGLSLSLAALGCLAILALGLIVVTSGNPVSAQAGDVLGFSVIAVRYDQLSGLFLIALGAIGVASSVFGIG